MYSHVFGVLIVSQDLLKNKSETHYRGEGLLLFARKEETLSQVRNMSGQIRNMSGQIRNISNQVRNMSDQVRNMSEC